MSEFLEKSPIEQDPPVTRTPLDLAQGPIVLPESRSETIYPVGDRTKGVRLMTAAFDRGGYIEVIKRRVCEVQALELYAKILAKFNGKEVRATFPQFPDKAPLVVYPEDVGDGDLIERWPAEEPTSETIG
ncbi:MAG TPA: hypothetical protein VJH75_04815 [Patescibacteria group bacterium]|nr:hypothetical protein [Patescibacteria group bacterium]